MKPETLKDLLGEGHIEVGEIRKIARGIFDGETTAAGPEGYLITAANFDDLPDACQQFIIKAVLEFHVTNVLDAAEDANDSDANDLIDGHDELAEPE